MRGSEHHVNQQQRHQQENEERKHDGVIMHLLNNCCCNTVQIPVCCNINGDEYTWNRLSFVLTFSSITPWTNNRTTGLYNCVCTFIAVSLSLRLTHRTASVNGSWLRQESTIDITGFVNGYLIDPPVAFHVTYLGLLSSLNDLEVLERKQITQIGLAANCYTSWMNK